LRNQNEIESAKYQEKAEQLLAGMRRLLGYPPPEAAAVALLAVHSSILLNDAIQVAVHGSYRPPQDHARAVTQLREVCSRFRLSGEGEHHLHWLIARKHRFAYTNQRLEDLEVRLASDHAERLFAWAYNEFRGVLRVPRTP
jgi:hypothetical protein